MFKDGDLLDQAALMRRVEGDRLLLERMVRAFAADWPRSLQAIRDSLSRQDAIGVQNAAHALKGSVGNFCAPDAYGTVLKVEMLGRAGDLSEAGAASQGLESLLQELTKALQQLIEDQGSGISGQGADSSE